MTSVDAYLDADWMRLPIRCDSSSGNVLSECYCQSTSF